MPIVVTTAGKIRGAVEDGVSVFRGIPYAAPPVGIRRFRPPVAPEPWPGVRDALDYGAVAAQDIPPVPEGGDSGEGYADIRSSPMSEDCLVLHVWTPVADAAGRPVMVWIHGGAYSGGSGHGSWSDGATLAREEDVVVVSLNHRLHAFGFLSLAAVGGEEYADSGNAGMLDIVAALAWVRDNVASFGGDPGNVTVFGESGGGWKITTLLAMPVARGLFHKAIVQSGSNVHAVSSGHADRMARRVLADLGIPEDAIERIRDVPTDQILAATTDVFTEGHPARILGDGTWNWNFVFAPVVDGRTLHREPFLPDAPPESLGIPLIVGTTRDEFGPDTARTFLPDIPDATAKATLMGMAPDTARQLVEVYRAERPASTDDDHFGELLSDTLMYMSAVRQAEAKVAQGDDPVYCYLFSWGWSRAADRAVHAIDVPLAFGNVVPELLGTERDDSTRVLAARMRTAWAAFARTGDPNHPGLPSWPVYTVEDRATMVFDHESRVENDPRSMRRRVLDGTP